MMQQISPLELSRWLADAGRPQPVLLDVRQPWEYETCHLPGSLPMPMAAVPARADELDRNADIVCICHHGGRSMQVAMFLERLGFGTIYNLIGGVEGWARDVDPNFPRY